MSCQPNELLEFAESLASSEHEVGLRTSISRAYYAVYHVAKTFDSFLPLIDGIDKRGGTHKQLTERFKHKNAGRLFNAVGYMLSDMCTRRESVDYHLDDDVLVEHAKYQIEAAKRLIARLDEFSASQVKEQA